MHLDDTGPSRVADDAVVTAARDAARDACHLADLAGRTGPERHAEHAIDASLRASRALFALEDAMRDAERTPLPEALAALAAAEDALRAAREALEARVTRTLRPEGAKAARRA